MAMAVYCTQVGKRQSQILCLILTIVLGLTFLGNQGSRVSQTNTTISLIPGQLIPGHPFDPKSHEHGRRRSSTSCISAGGATVKNVEMFYWIYFAMTGMHAVHMIIGIGIMLVFCSIRRSKGRYGPEYHSPVEIIRTLLALRRYRLDFSVPVALFAGPAPGTPGLSHERAHRFRQSLPDDLSRPDGGNER